MSLVKDLREKSGAPISDVKSALVEANWDPGTSLACLQKFPHVPVVSKQGSLSAAESAYQNLRKKGLAAASKKVWPTCLPLNTCHWPVYIFHGIETNLQASRLAAEGLVGIATAQHKAAMVEVLFSCHMLSAQSLRAA